MRPCISNTVFEIVEGEFVFRGWNVRGDHMYKAETPQLLHFGDTGIMLRLVDGEPRLTVPKGQDAELLKSNHSFTEGKRVDGEFVEVRIY